MKSNLPKPPAHIAPFVDVLGVDQTIEVLLRFGGAPIYIPADPKGSGELERLVGREKTIALSKRIGELYMRMPLAKRWVAQVLTAQGHSRAEVARKLHVTDVTVRRYLAPSDSKQLPLF